MGFEPMPANVRPYEPRDLGRLIRLWERAAILPASPGRLSVDQLVDLISSSDVVTLVAEEDADLVGMAFGSTTAVVGWIHGLTLAGQAPTGDVFDQLLDDLEARLAERGARRLAALGSEADPAWEHLERRGYRAAKDLAYLEREVPSTMPFPSSLADLGARLIGPGLWDHLKGMEEAKEIIERRVILPLVEPGLAARHAVAPPKAIVLFGPPGTGKTTFAKGIASRLTWPFIEIQPAELGGEGPEQQARLLARTFDKVLDLSSAVVFVDEVEDLASMRHQERRVSPSVTNEFLRQMPRIREAPHHLMVCATNAVGTLDPAFLRPGRFDYVLPVGPPNEEARKAIWHRYVDEITDQPVALDRLVDATKLFTPADIEFAARKAAQRAFERQHFEGVADRASTEDFLGAIGDTRPTLTEEMVRAFEEDAGQFARY
jgi:hypothetical protein